MSPSNSKIYTMRSQCIALSLLTLVRPHDLVTGPQPSRDIASWDFDIPPFGDSELSNVMRRVRGARESLIRRHQRSRRQRQDESDSRDESDFLNESEDSLF